MPLPERDIHALIDLPLVYLTKLSGGELDPRPATIEFQSLIFSAYTGFLHLSKAVEGFVYFTASEEFLQRLVRHPPKPPGARERMSFETMSEVTGAMGESLQHRFGVGLQISPPRIFSTEVPKDPIEMPPAVYVLPLLWQSDQAFLVIGLNPPGEEGKTG